MIYLLSAIRYLLQITISNYIPHIQMLSLVAAMVVLVHVAVGGKKLDFISTALNRSDGEHKTPGALKRSL